MDTWVDSHHAIELAKQNDFAPDTYMGLIWAGIRGKFIRKAPDEIHWEFNRKEMVKYFQLRNKYTLSSIMKITRKPSSSIYRIMNQLGIEMKEKMGHKYLEDDDAEQLIKHYRKDYNGKSKKV